MLSAHPRASHLDTLISLYLFVHGPRVRSNSFPPPPLAHVTLFTLRSRARDTPTELSLWFGRERDGSLPFLAPDFPYTHTHTHTRFLTHRHTHTSVAVSDTHTHPHRVYYFTICALTVIAVDHIECIQLLLSFSIVVIINSIILVNCVLSVLLLYSWSHPISRTPNTFTYFQLYVNAIDCSACVIR